MIKLKIFISALVFLFTIEQSFPQIDTLDSKGIDTSNRRWIEIQPGPGFGVSLVRNTLAPAFFLNLGFNISDKYKFRVNTLSNFFFERDVNRDFDMYRNSFINVDFLTTQVPSFVGIENKNKKQNLKWYGLGFGYLIENNGAYFKDSTFKISFPLERKHVTIVSEIIFTDEKVFPGMSILFY